MTEPRLSRRGLLALGAATGAATLVRAPAAGWAASSSAARSFVLDVPAAAWSRGGGRATGVLKAPRRFALVGLRGRGLDGAGLELRVRPRGGVWSPWTPLGFGADHAPDHPRVAGATDPVWAGGADEFQLRARRAPRGLRAHLVSVPPARARPRAAARAADGAAGPPPIISRADWGAAKVPPRTEPSYGDVQLAFVHHTVSANGYRPEDSAAIVLAIAKYHRDANGWSDIGYNLLVDQFGQIFEGRAGGISQAVVGAQAQGWNSHSTGIATIGTFTDEAFPEAGLAALARVLAWKLSVHGVPTTGTVEVVSAGGAANRYRSGARVAFDRISGHRDGCTTSCPGTALYAQLPVLRSRASALAGPLQRSARLTVSPVDVEVAYGRRAGFRGTLVEGGGQPVGGVRVTLEKQGTKRWVTVGAAVTAADGTWRSDVTWRRGAAVRARASVPGAGDVRSAPVSVACGHVLEVDPMAKRVLRTRSAVVTGRLKPGGPVKVRIERQFGGRWVRVADVSAKVSSSGRFRATTRMTRPGVYRLRVLGGVRARLVRSPAVYLRVVRRAADLGRGSGGQPVRTEGVSTLPSSPAGAATAPTGAPASSTSGAASAPATAAPPPAGGGLAAG